MYLTFTIPELTEVNNVLLGHTFRHSYSSSVQLSSYLYQLILQCLAIQLSKLAHTVVSSYLVIHASSYCSVQLSSYLCQLILQCLAIQLSMLAYTVVSIYLAIYASSYCSVQLSSYLYELILQCLAIQLSILAHTVVSSYLAIYSIIVTTLPPLKVTPKYLITAPPNQQQL